MFYRSVRVKLLTLWSIFAKISVLHMKKKNLLINKEHNNQTRNNIIFTYLDLKNV